jgi:preprotein translocase subunit SecA
MNKQRIFFYGLRTEILKGNTKEYVLRVAAEVVEGLVYDYLPQKGERDIEAFKERIEQLFAMDALDFDSFATMPQQEATETLTKIVHSSYQEKERKLGSEDILRWHERVAILQIIDSAWKRHLLVMDHLKEAIGFRGYGQKDPLVEYKRESYEYFENMRFGYEDEIISYLFRVQPQPAFVSEERPSQSAKAQQTELQDDDGFVESYTDKSNPNGIQRVMRFSVGGVDDDE